MNFLPEYVLRVASRPKRLSIGRYVAIHDVTDNAKDKAKQYTRLFNKVRQAAITREITEITSGIEAMC